MAHSQQITPPDNTHDLTGLEIASASIQDAQRISRWARSLLDRCHAAEARALVLEAKLRKLQKGS